MTVLLVTVGVTLVAVAMVDLGWTTVAAGSGAGPLTGPLAGGLWRVALRLHRRRPSHALLSAAGVVIVFVLLVVWIALVLTGWTLVFSAGDGAVREATTGVPADLTARVYFTGFSVFTLGLGDYAPGDGLWQLATVLATGTGLILVTLSITYLVPVASAVALRRQLASYIDSLGRSPHEILCTGWDGTGFTGLAQHLVAITPLLQRSRQQHLTYPVLHYFHSRERGSAAAPNITTLAQALHLLQHGVTATVRPPPATLQPLERSIDAFLTTLRRAHLAPTDPLPLPPLAPIRSAGIPVVADGAYRSAAEETETRRALLGGLLADDGWPARSPDTDT